MTVLWFWTDFAQVRQLYINCKKLTLPIIQGFSTVCGLWLHISNICYMYFHIGLMDIIKIKYMKSYFIKLHSVTNVSSRPLRHIKSSEPIVKPIFTFHLCINTKQTDNMSHVHISSLTFTSFLIHIHKFAFSLKASMTVVRTRRVNNAKIKRQINACNKISHVKCSYFSWVSTLYHLITAEWSIASRGPSSRKKPA